MSAYMVEREHIEYLLNAAMVVGDDRGGKFSWYHDGEWHYIYCTDDPGKQAEYGQMLWDENRRSIEYRYPDTAEDFSNAPGPIGEDFKYTRHTYRYHPVDPYQVITSARCFAYQSCEHPGWEDSEAYAFIQALERSAVDTLINRYERAGNKLEWGAPPVMPSGRQGYSKQA